MGAISEATPTGMTEKPSHDQIPDSTILSEASSLRVKDANGKEIPFKSLYTDSATSEKHLIIFIRHFFCGLCEEYIRNLSKSLPPTLLYQHSTTLTIIGCGDPALISDYKNRTGCAFEVYADPKRQLYKTLGMVSNFQQPEKRPEYYGTLNMVGVVVASLGNALKSGTKAWKSGPAWQQGGEWLFEGGELKWCHRMRNVGDHTEVKGLKEVLGIEA